MTFSGKTAMSLQQEMKMLTITQYQNMQINGWNYPMTAQYFSSWSLVDWPLVDWSLVESLTNKHHR